MADRIQLRRDAAPNWTAVNPVLADGEIGLEKDTGLFKIGTGILPWNDLAYGGLQGVQGPPGPALSWGSIPGTLSDQTDLNTALAAKAPVANPAFTGIVTLGGALREEVATLSGALVALTALDGTLQRQTLSANTSYIDALSHGEAITLMITAQNSVTVTWPVITWLTNAGDPPVLNAPGLTTFVLWKIDTTLYGALVGEGG